MTQKNYNYNLLFTKPKFISNDYGMLVFIDLMSINHKNTLAIMLLQFTHDCSTFIIMIYNVVFYTHYILLLVYNQYI